MAERKSLNYLDQYNIFNPNDSFGQRVNRAEAAQWREGPVSGKLEFNRDSYDLFRPGEKQPSGRTDVLQKCDDIYDSFGIVQDIIDLQVIFACHGIRVSHPVKSHEKLFRAWAKSIKMADISAKIMHGLYLRNCCIIGRDKNRLSIRDEKRMRTEGARKITTGFNFIDPKSVILEDEADYAVLDDHVYYIAYSSKNKNIKANLAKRDYIKSVTEDKIILDTDKLEIIHYKKDDWKPWALPSLFSVFEDVDMVKKMALADRTIVDGAVNKIRVFKLGDIEKKIVPEKGAYDTLNSMLSKNGGGNITDIIWSEDLDIIETKLEGYEFLGKDKFEPYIERIYMALGMPILTGTSRGTAQTSSVSLNSLVKRLERGRDLLRDFWDREFEDLRIELGIKKRPVIEFNYPNLGDEASFRAILVQMADRNMISDEFVHRVINADSDLETARINREEKQRESGRRVRKTSPYGEGDLENYIKKHLITRGLAKPESLDIELEMAEEDEQENPISPGRPKNAMDKEPRKTRVYKAASSIDTSAALDEITGVLKKYCLEFFGKKSIRELSNAETEYYESLRIMTLFNIKDVKSINEDIIIDAATASTHPLFKEYTEICRQIAFESNKPLTLENKNKIAVVLYNEYI
jgi:hypothetical protein